MSARTGAALPRRPHHPSPLLLLFVIVTYWNCHWNWLTVPRCQLSTYDGRAFDYAVPTVWNSLHDELSNSDSFDSFQWSVKTILFSHY